MNIWRNTPPYAAIGYVMAYCAAQARHCKTASAVYASTAEVSSTEFLAPGQ